MEIPLNILLVVVAVGWIWHAAREKAISNLDVIVALTLVLFIIALLQHTLVFIALLGAFSPGTWYLHSLAPLLAPWVARGLAKAAAMPRARTIRLRPRHLSGAVPAVRDRAGTLLFRRLLRRAIRPRTYWPDCRSILRRIPARSNQPFNGAGEPGARDSAVWRGLVSDADWGPACHYTALFYTGAARASGRPWVMATKLASRPSGSTTTVNVTKAEIRNSSSMGFA